MRSASRPLAALAALTLAVGAQAADHTSFSSLAAWQAAAGTEWLVQDFQGYGDGQPIGGVEFLPGVSATSSLAELRVFQSGSNRFMFGLGDRDTAAARYDLAFTRPYGAVALDITSFEAQPGAPSTAAGPGLLTVWFADASSAQFQIEGNPTGAPVFFGIVANQSITGIRWTEALEGDGFSEETGLDNIRVAAVPEPATSVMGLLGMAVLALRRRRRG